MSDIMSDPRVKALAYAAQEALFTMADAKQFVFTNQKMRRPEGLDLYQQDMDRLRHALREIKQGNSDGLKNGAETP